MSERKYLPTLAELIDRLSIAQLKEVKIPEHKVEYAQEIADIVHDIQLCLDSSDKQISGDRMDYKIDCLAAEFKDWEISW